MTGNRKNAKNFIWDKAGFSLVEMIIVIAVFGILAGASLSMMGHIRYANTERAVEMISNELNKQQVYSMCKQDKPYIYIYEKDGAYYLRTLNANYDAYESTVFTTDGIKLCSNSIAIYTSKAGSAEDVLDGSDFIKIVFNRSGSFSSATNVDNIRIEGNASHTIKLIADTGKHVVK